MGLWLEGRVVREWAAKGEDYLSESLRHPLGHVMRHVGERDYPSTGIYFIGMARLRCEGRSGGPWIGWAMPLILCQAKRLDHDVRKSGSSSPL